MHLIQLAKAASCVNILFIHIFHFLGEHSNDSLNIFVYYYSSFIELLLNEN